MEALKEEQIGGRTAYAHTGCGLTLESPGGPGGMGAGVGSPWCSTPPILEAAVGKSRGWSGQGKAPQYREPGEVAADRASALQGVNDDAVCPEGPEGLCETGCTPHWP